MKVPLHAQGKQKGESLKSLPSEFNWLCSLRRTSDLLQLQPDPGRFYRTAGPDR